MCAEKMEEKEECMKKRKKQGEVEMERGAKLIGWWAAQREECDGVRMRDFEFDSESCDEELQDLEGRSRRL